MRTIARNARRQVEWETTNAALADTVPPALAWDPVTEFPAREDRDGNWRRLTYLQAPALVARQTRDLKLYRPIPGTRAAHRLPLLAFDPVTGLVAQQLGTDWWWMDVDTTPVDPGWNAWLVRYEQVGAR